ncbi:MAG: D-aminoacyl-tRNA deacylase [Eubacteriales bacterium]
MRAVIQRVNTCTVEINGELFSQIDEGILVLLGIKDDDVLDDILYLVDKIVNLRIFEDEQGKMNKSIIDMQKQIMVVSQFTLYGDCKKGRRPSYIRAARPEKAKKLYKRFLEEIKKNSLLLRSGVFGADMKVKLENDGPVTILLDSEKQF